MDIVYSLPLLDTDPDIVLHRATAMFACFVGKSEYGPWVCANNVVEVYRNMGDDEDKVRCS